MTYGEFVKEKRIQLGIGLRDFCRQIKFDPGNWVRVEGGKSCAPRSIKKLQRIAGVLNILADDMDEYYHLAARTFLPPDLKGKI